MTGLSDDNGSLQTGEEQVFEQQSQESLNLKISESQSQMEPSRPEVEVEASLHLRMSETHQVNHGFIQFCYE